MADKRITNEPDNDYRLAGIATSLREYKLCHYLNRLLGCDFRKLEPLTFEPKDRSRKIQFSVFKAEQPETNDSCFVFANKNGGDHLLPEVSNFDFIIQFRGKFKEENMKKILEGAREIEEVVLCAEIPLRKIKSRERLQYLEQEPAQARFKGLARKSGKE